MSKIRVCPKCHGHNSECYYCGGGGADTPSPEEEIGGQGLRKRRNKTATDEALERRRERAKKNPKVIAEGQARLRRLEKQRLAEEREERRQIERAAAEKRAAMRRAEVRTWPWWKRLLHWLYRAE